jgi:hypothetical protein
MTTIKGADKMSPPLFVPYKTRKQHLLVKRFGSCGIFSYLRSM